MFLNCLKRFSHIEQKYRLCLGIIDYPNAIKQLHYDFVKSFVWLASHSLGRKRGNLVSDLQNADDCSAQTQRKNFVSISSLSKPGVVEPVAAAPRSLIKQNREEETYGKQRSTNFFKKSSKIFANADLNPNSPSMGSLASILASESETSLRKAKSLKPYQTTVSPIPGTMNTEDDLWELESDLSDSGFEISVKNVFAKSGAEVKGMLAV